MARMAGDTKVEKEQKAQQALIRDIAVNLARLLTDWKPLTKEYSYRAKVIREDGAEIWIRIDGDHIRTG